MQYELDVDRPYDHDEHGKVTILCSVTQMTGTLEIVTDSSGTYPSSSQGSHEDQIRFRVVETGVVKTEEFESFLDATVGLEEFRR